MSERTLKRFLSDNGRIVGTAIAVVSGIAAMALLRRRRRGSEEHSNDDFSNARAESMTVSKPYVDGMGRRILVFDDTAYDDGTSERNGSARGNGSANG